MDYNYFLEDIKWYLVDNGFDSNIINLNYHSDSKIYISIYDNITTFAPDQSIYKVNWSFQVTNPNRTVAREWSQKINKLLLNKSGYIGGERGRPNKFLQIYCTLAPNSAKFDSNTQSLWVSSYSSFIANDAIDTMYTRA